MTADNPSGYTISSSHSSLIVSILSAGTFFGSIAAAPLADKYGRRTTIIAGCGIFSIGVVLEICSLELATLVVGRFVAGIGVGFGEFLPSRIRRLKP